MRITYLTSLSLTVLLSAFLISPACLGQESSVSLTTGVAGTVRDSSGGVVPNASVELSSNVGPSQKTSTDGQGQYSFRALRPGSYSVAVTVPGFADFKGHEFALRDGQTERQEVTLQAAGVQSVTNVAGDVPQVETEDSTVSGVLSSKEVTELPTNGRTFNLLLALTPGVSNQTGQDEGRVGVQGSAAFSVNGGRTEYNSFELDGSDLLNVGFNGSVNTLIVYPSLDAIGELKILTSNYGAMYGRTASGTVLVTTKSGTTTFHGDLYYFNRNEAFNARNFFDQTKGAPLYRRHDLGGTVGGPVYIPGLYNTHKEKTFFFFSEEYRNEKTPYEFNQAVPSAAERNGDFSDVCPGGSQLIQSPGLSPYFYRASPRSGVRAYPDCPYVAVQGIVANGQTGYGYIPYQITNPATGAITYNQIFDPDNQRFMNRNAAAILAAGVIPLPNNTAGCNSTIGSCYDATVAEPTHWREELFRIDHYFNENTHFTARFIHDSWDTVTSTPQYGLVANSFPTIQNNFSGPGISAVVRLSQTLSPTLLNEVFVSYANSHVTLTDANGPGARWQRPAALDAPCQYSTSTVSGLLTDVECPMGYIFNNGFGGKLPGLVFNTGPAYGGGFAVDAGYMPWSHRNPVYTFGDSMSKQWGKHFLQFGSEFTIYHRTQTNSVTGAATGEAQGILTYNNTEGQGNAFATFLSETPTSSLDANGNQIGEPLGNTPYSFQQDSAQRVYRQTYENAEPYLQDDWKVTPALTVNLGVRISLFGRYHEDNKNVYNWLASAYNPVLASQIDISQIHGNLEYVTNLALTGTGTPIFFGSASQDPHITNGLVRCGYGGVPAGCTSGHVFNPAPRVGFAWDPFGSGKTSVRGGYGIFFEHGTGNEANTGALEGSAPLVLSSTEYGLTDISCIGGANAVGCGDPWLPGQTPAFPLNVTSVQTKTQWPYVQQWSFSIQRQLPSSVLASFAYVGSKGTHLTAERQINSLKPVPSSQNPFGAHEPLLPSIPGGSGQDCATNVDPNNNYVQAYLLSSGAYVDQGTPAYNSMYVACARAGGSSGLNQNQVANLRPYLGLGQIVALDNIANSSYNAFQFTLRRSQGPLTLGLSYTYSHSLDDSSDRFDPVPYAFDLRSNRSGSNFDQRHLLNVSYVYDLPLLNLIGNSQKSRLARLALGGWQWSGIAIFQTGTPFSVVNAGDNLNFVSAADNAGVANDLGIGSYPDLVGNPHTKPPAVSANSAVGTTIGPLLLNPGAFAAPRGLTFGTAGRNSLNNPDRWNFDMSAYKSFRLGEGQNLQFRAEAFNIFNHTQFEIYNPIRHNQPNNTIDCYGDAASSYSAAGGSCLVYNPSFLRPIDAHRPRTLQLALKLTF